MNDAPEIFLPIYETMGRYEISNYGRVRSWYFQGKRRGEPKILKPGLSKGYPCVVFVVNGDRKTQFIHRLLATHFISNPNKYSEINHIDGNRANNELSNLEWCTHQYNCRHIVDVLDKKNGCKMSSSIFNEAQLLEILTLRRRDKKSAKEIAKAYNCDDSTIANICAGRRYKKEVKRLKIN